MVEQENTHVSPISNNSAHNQNFLNWIILDPPNTIIEESSYKKEKFPISDERNSVQKEELQCMDYLFDNQCPDEKLLNEFNEDWKPQVETVPSVSDPYFEGDRNFYWDVCQNPFQVDLDDLIQGPTLAELNANDESALDSFEVFPDHSTMYKDFNPILKNQNVEQNQNIVSSEQDVHSMKSATVTKESELQSSFLNEKLQDGPVTTPKGPHFINKTFDSSNTISKRKRAVTESEEDSSDNDYSSTIDEESDNEIEKCTTESTACKMLQQKKKKFFWQYNLQSKGPKDFTMRLTEKSNVHDGLGVSDPVKNLGKSRKGDGNDFSPNPKKLYNIGLELEKLNTDINKMTPANELPASARSKSRKEKNKLASRACRLKKKAQHEANKIKLFGLQREQKQLIKCINEVKKVVNKKIEKPKKYLSTTSAVESLIKKKTVTKVAGCTTEFVNKVISAVASGDESGGLKNL